ncbi:MAG: thioredoxin family protein, partial [Bacteroidetes bacterium]|nr:thioredoxin family protein [Bacteroidota bacterium]
NDAMADQYNSKGDFPLTVLLDANGRVLKSWNGLPSVKAEAFAREVRGIIDQQP